MALGLRRLVSHAGVVILIAGCGISATETASQCLLSVAEAKSASGMPITTAEAWDQDESRAGPACLYTDGEGSRLNLMWRESTPAETAAVRDIQAQNPAHFEERDDLADGAFVGANGIPSVFVPLPAGHLVIVEMLDGIDAKPAAAGLAVAAAERCCS